MVSLHSPITMEGKFSGATIEWRDGKLSGDEDLVNAILDYADQIEETGRPVFIEDMCFGHRNLLATNVTAYALACMVDEMKIIEGEIPNPEDLFKNEEKTRDSFDGGPGSGNFGHSGRPGKVGGSGEGGENTINFGHKGPAGQAGGASLTRGMTQQNTETAEQFHRAVRFVEKRIDKKPAGAMIKCEYAHDPLRRSSVFVKEADGTWTQHTYAGRIPLGRVHGWTSYMVGAEFVNNVKDTAEELTVDGGPGSGNFSHSGRPGHVGGSGKGGGKSFRVGSKATGYSGMHRSPEFEGIAQHARDNATYVDFIKAMTTGQKEKLKAQHQAVGTKESLQDYSKRIYEMLHGKKAGKVSAAAPHKIAEGKDITATFTRRQDTFPNEIDDVIDAQGFNGKPKVVTKEEFDKIAKEHPEIPLLFRSYAAPDQATLDQYNRQLEGKEGDWYVDCGTGGAVQGQGMYCAGVYDHDSREQMTGAKIEMRHYRRINEERSEKKLNEMLKETGKLHESGDVFDIRGGVPEYLRQGIPSGGSRYYKIGQDGITFTDHNDLKDKLEPNGEYMLTWEADSEHNWRYSGKITVNSEGDILYPRGDEVRDSYIDSISNRNPIVYPLERMDFETVATTRRMTLDPSAKIITTKQLDGLRDKINLKNAQDFISSIKDPTPYIEDARKTYLDSLTNRNIDKGAIDAIFQEVLDHRGMKTVMLRGTGTSPWSASSDSKTRSQIAWAIAAEAEYGDKSNWRKIPEYKPFFELVDTMPEFKNEVARLQNKAADYGKRMWKQNIAKNAHKYPQIPKLPYDNGVFAAKAGYDAINSEGHGRSGSYTIVLNRTKVIIDKDPWEVYS